MTVMDKTQEIHLFQSRYIRCNINTFDYVFGDVLNIANVLSKKRKEIELVKWVIV